MRGLQVGPDREHMQKQYLHYLFTFAANTARNTSKNLFHRIKDTDREKAKAQHEKYKTWTYKS